MGPTWGRQDPGGPHVGRVNLAISEVNSSDGFLCQLFLDKKAQFADKEIQCSHCICILIRISLKFIPKDPIYNRPTLTRVTVLVLNV